MAYYIVSNELTHYGILGQKWGVRRYQNSDGSLTEAGKKRYSKEDLEQDIRDLKFAGRGYDFVADTAVKIRYYDKLIADKEKYNEAVDSYLDFYVKKGAYTKQEAREVRPAFFDPDWLDYQHEVAEYWYDNHPKEKAIMMNEVSQTRQKMKEIMQRTIDVGVKAAEAHISKRALEDVMYKANVSYQYQALAAYDDYRDSKRS